ncbi:MAG TPA: hypothetical protein VFS89_10130, partial [Nitrosospira sp.]|nr:hypothetical protein [Nitrosospira sp.]
MKNTKKNYPPRNPRPARDYFRILPIAAAMAASGFIQPALAVDRTWFGGAGDWGVDTNWSPTGVPGISDKAIINSGNSTLSFNTGITGLDLSSGTLSGTGNLTLSGLSSWTGGSISGAASTTFNDTLDIIGNNGKGISGTRVINLNDTTTWGGNTGNSGNTLFFSNGTINNAGTFND